MSKILASKGRLVRSDGSMAHSICPDHLALTRDRFILSEIGKEERMPCPPTLSEIRSWPPTVGIATAAPALGVSRSYAFELAKQDKLPCRVIKVGSRHRVVTSSLIALLENGSEMADQQGGNIGGAA